MRTAASSSDVNRNKKRFEREVCASSFKRGKSRDTRLLLINVILFRFIPFPLPSRTHLTTQHLPRDVIWIWKSLLATSSMLYYQHLLINNYVVWNEETWFIRFFLLYLETLINKIKIKFSVYAIIIINISNAICEEKRKIFERDSNRFDHRSITNWRNSKVNRSDTPLGNLNGLRQNAAGRTSFPIPITMRRPLRRWAEEEGKKEKLKKIVYISSHVRS